MTQPTHDQKFEAYLAHVVGCAAAWKEGSGAYTPELLKSIAEIREYFYSRKSREPPHCASCSCAHWTEAAQPDSARCSCGRYVWEPNCTQIEGGDKSLHYIDRSCQPNSAESDPDLSKMTGVSPADVENDLYRSDLTDEQLLQKYGLSRPQLEEWISE